MTSDLKLKSSVSPALSLALLMFLAAAPASAQIIERASVASGQGDRQSTGGAISADGRFVAFPTAAQLEPGGTDQANVHLRDRALGTTRRLTNSGLHETWVTSMSPDGRFIVVTEGSWRHPSGFWVHSGVAVLDRSDGMWHSVADGSSLDGHSDLGDISTDGRLVAFWSAATNVVAGDTNGSGDIFVHDRQTGATNRVSVSSAGIEANSDSYAPTISSDGRYVAFASFATNLVVGDTSFWRDIFVHDLQTGTTSRVSISSSGVEGDGPSSAAAISGDGRYAAFSSFATNLVPGDTNSTSDIFVHDRQTGTTSRVSVSSDGIEANDWSTHARISADGRYVAYTSKASNLVPGDTNGLHDVFVHDRQTGATSRVSVSSDGSEGDRFSTSLAISAGGRHVVFETSATNLVPGDTNGVDDVFVHDRQTGETTRESVATVGPEANGASRFGSLSGEGRFAAFQSDATDLVPSDANGYTDIFVHDREGGGTNRVSVDSSGVEANGASADPVISANGRFVAFRSDASNLVPGDINLTDVFVHDQDTKTTSLATVSSSGVQSDGASIRPSISGDGRYVAFESLGRNLVANDTNGRKDIFVRDLQTGTTTRVSVDSTGVEGNHNSYSASVSEDGRFVAFESGASNLVSGDTNSRRDIFVHELQTGATSRVLDSSGVQADDLCLAPSISGDGRFVAFMSSATNLVAGDGNGVDDIFVHDRQTGATSRVSIDSAGLQGNGHSRWPWISGDGRFVGFESEASNLVPNDLNAVTDVFVHDCWSGMTARVSVDGAGGEVAGDSSTARLSADGSAVTFMSSDAALVPNDTNGQTDVFIRSLRFALALSGVPKNPNPVHYAFLNGWGEAGNQALVLISCTGTSPGTPLPGDPRMVPITSDACTSLGLNLLTFHQGTIDSTGYGTTLTIPFPAVGSGIAIYAAAVTVDAAGGGFVSISDPIVYVTE